jgi:hypothetical protein
MGLLFSLDEATPAGDGIWRASLRPAFLRALGPALQSDGALSVILVSESARYEPERKLLSFPAEAARVLNVGTSENALVIEDCATNVAPAGESKANSFKEVEQDFLATVPPAMSAIAKKLVAGVRVHQNGRLELREPSGRWVDTPDNFWTIKVQPRVRTFRITLRGRPITFATTSRIKVSDDRPGYSTFVLATEEQVSDAIQLIREAAKH